MFETFIPHTTVSAPFMQEYLSLFNLGKKSWFCYSIFTHKIRIFLNCFLKRRRLIRKNSTFLEYFWNNSSILHNKFYFFNKSVIPGSVKDEKYVRGQDEKHICQKWPLQKNYLDLLVQFKNNSLKFQKYYKKVILCTAPISF